jgi:hypothetical protein
MNASRYTILDFKNHCTEAFIRKGLHLIGCEFYTGNREVDGWVTSTDTLTNPVYIRGNKGYARSLEEILLYIGDENETPVSYGAYMQHYYPEYYQTWKWQVPKDKVDQSA